ncbi:Ig-like domain-containing protein [Kangiella koreensis]|uniref:LVIVD repeat protein n=1 Tax=Kangiella koreensis (strain DSM 16069 / JCM 12317 / KCTC 12182 / SW-125) TaxID=523791 RepID=C7RAZ3_KANKD|nr:Ig-like domain-containing protein [Kangiella koreensis]ACV26435.1 LVIVD repeat protein [Kangiella koreensis DSM 16069]
MKKVIPFLASALAFLPQSVISQDTILVDTGEVYGHGPYYGVEAYGNASYVNDGSKEIKVFDVSDASNITLSGEVEVGCTVDDLDLDGATLVAKCPFEIHFYDLTDSLNPELVGSYDSTSYAVNSVELSGDRLYIGGGNTDIVIFNASDLSNIQELNSQTFDSISTGELKKSANFVYSISDFDTVKIFDVSNEENIIKTSEINATATLFKDVLIIDNTLYIAATDGLRVYDVTNMASPSYVKTIDSGSFFNTIDLLNALHVVGDTLYAGKSNAWIFEFDITTPLDPAFLGQFRYSTGTTNQITDNGTNMFIAFGIDGLATAEMQPMDKLDHFLVSILPNDLSMDNGRLLASDETGLFHVIDVENSFIPKSRIPYISNTFSGEIKNNTAWLGTGIYLETIDLSTLNPSSQIDIQTPDASAEVTYLNEIGDTLYLGTSSGMVAMYDVSGNVPSLIASITFPVHAETNSPQYITDVVPYGDYLLASSIESELLIADFSNLASPAVVNVPELSEVAEANLFVTGDKLLSASDWGAFLIDISDIENPTYYGTQLVELGLITSATRLDADQVLLSSTEGLLTVNIADPDNITIVSKIESAPEFSSVATDGSHVVGALHYESELKLYKFNKSPTTSDYEFSVDEDSSIVEYVEATDPDGDEIVFSIVSQPDSGSVSITSAGQFTYEPNADFNGQDTFTFEAEDTYGGSSEGSVSITINSVNDAPTASSVSLTTTVDKAVSGSFNASDVDGDELTYENTNPSNGSLSVSGSGFTYTPAAGFSGQDSFQYTVTDSGGESVTANVTITVNKPASSGGGGGSSDLWLLALLLLGFTFRRHIR